MSAQPRTTQLNLFGSPLERSRESLFETVRLAIGSVKLKQHLVLITIDIQEFREINMLYGFENGDFVLETVVDRLQGVLRPQDSLFRSGDDEFSILLNPVLHQDHGLLAVHKIHQLFERPIMIAETEHTIDMNIGLSLYPDTAIEGEELVRQSVFASYLAKDSHDECVIYDASLEVGNKQRQLVSQQVKEALYSGHIRLVYQPIFDRNGGIKGVESLSRWVRGANDTVSPADFIPAIEETGLMQRFTQWALNTALRECADFADLFITVNISATNLEDPDFPDLVKRALSTWSVEPSRLILEVTETAVMRDVEIAHHVLDRLSELGVMLAIDDFGSGYSSLKYIRDLPVSYLKIDGSFIENLRSDSEDTVIVDAVCKLGRSFGLKVIGEGVENEEGQQMAIELGCDLLQGYHLSRPIELAQLEQALEE